MHGLGNVDVELLLFLVVHRVYRNPVLFFLFKSGKTLRGEIIILLLVGHKA